MNTKYVDISLVIDRSGSMSSIKEATESGLKEFIQGHRFATAENDLKTRITYVQFDDVYEMLVRNSDIQAFELPTLNPRGSTALYDAIGRTISDTGKRLSDLPESRRPGKVLFVIVTDGFENASKEYNKYKIAEMIKHQRSKYSWEFVFLGANIDAQEVATNINIPLWNTMTFGANAAGAASAFASVRGRTLSYATGATQNANFLQADYDTQLKVGGVANKQSGGNV